MFYVELEPKNNNKDIYEIGSLLDCRIRTTVLNVRFLSVLTTRDTDTLKVFAFVGRDKSNVQETNQPLITHAERNPKTLNAFCARTIIQPTTKIVWFTRICEGISFQYYGENGNI